MGVLAKYADASAAEAALDKGVQAYERTEQMYTKSEVDAMIQELTDRITSLETPTGTEE